MRIASAANISLFTTAGFLVITSLIGRDGKFLSEAKVENNQPAVASFSNALAVEKIHHTLYSNALTSLKIGLLQICVLAYFS